MLCVATFAEDVRTRRVECVRLSRMGHREGRWRYLVSLSSGRVCGQILAALLMDAERVPARPYRAPGWARRCPREETVPFDDSVSAAAGCRAELGALSRSSARDAAGIRRHRRWPGGWRPQGIAAPAGQQNDHPSDLQAYWTLRRPNASACTSWPVALSRSLST